MAKLRRTNVKIEDVTMEEKKNLDILAEASLQA